MRPTLTPLAAIGLALVLAGATSAQEGPAQEGGPGGGGPPDPCTPPDPNHPGGEARRELEARRRQILQNLEAWKRMSAEEKERLRQKRRHGSLRQLLKEERRRLRERHAALEQRFREHVLRGRQGVPEGLKELDPIARKRYFYLRRILKGLTKEQRAELGELADEERKRATRELLMSDGSRIFTGELARFSPACKERFESLEKKQRRKVFRTWLETPSSNLRAFLRERELFLPGDPPGQRRPKHPGLRRGEGKGPGPPKAPPGDRARHPRRERGAGHEDDAPGHREERPRDGREKPGEGERAAPDKPGRPPDKPGRPPAPPGGDRR